MAASSKQRQSRDLCDNLWLEIFKRLPIKSLCGLRCVCKSWNSLFTSRFFITLHHNYLSSLAANQESYFPLEKYYPLPLHPLYHQDEPRLCQHATYLRPPLEDEGRHVRFVVIGVLHGIVCLATEEPSQYESSAILWNPATRKHISIRFQPYGGCPFDMGFGFDSVKDDFKLVMTALPWYNVFSVEEGRWRESKTVNSALKGYKTRPTCGICFTNGRIHWIARSHGNTYPLHLSDDELKALRYITYTFVLLLFDCESEQFEAMEFPQQLIPNGREDKFMCDLAQLFTYCDMLSVLKETAQCSKRYELWVMEEHGVASSWKKLFKIDNRPCVTNDQLLMLGRDGILSQPSVKELSLYGSRPMDPFRMDRPQPLNCQGFVESLFLMDVNLKQHRGGDAKGSFYLDSVVRLSYSTYAGLSNLLRRASNWY